MHESSFSERYTQFLAYGYFNAIRCLGVGIPSQVPVLFFRPGSTSPLMDSLVCAAGLDARRAHGHESMVISKQPVDKKKYIQRHFVVERHSSTLPFTAETLREKALSLFPNAESVALAVIDIAYDYNGKPGSNAEIWVEHVALFTRSKKKSEEQSLLLIHTALEACTRPLDSLPQDIHALAVLAALDNNTSYYRAARVLLSGIPEPLQKRWRKYNRSSVNAGLFSYKELPVYPLQPVKPESAGFVMMALTVLGGMFFNAPPLLLGAALGYLFRKKGRDFRLILHTATVIPSGILWASFIIYHMVIVGQLVLVLGYLALTALLPKFYNPFRRSAVSLYNMVIFPALRRRFLELRKVLLVTLCNR